MKLTDLFQIMDPDTLVSIELCENDDIVYCGPMGDITLSVLMDLKNQKVGLIFPDKYGKYCGRSGITIYVENVD